MRYRAVDELEHFRFHDARIVAQEWTDGNLVWTIEALNVTTAFSGCDFETDLEIERVRMTFENARVFVDAEISGGLRRMDADEAKRFMVERLVAEQPWLSYLMQDEQNRAVVEIVTTEAGELFILTLSYSRAVIEWDAYAGEAWYLERRPGV
jgi:hypothetical protein